MTVVDPSARISMGGAADRAGRSFARGLKDDIGAVLGSQEQTQQAL
jgi:hypothetical protein